MSEISETQNIGSEESLFTYHLLTDPAVRAELYQDTYGFVQTILQKKLKRRPETIFFLDRSARPSAWLFREVWDQVAEDIPMPDIKFINIGKEKAPDFMGVFEGSAVQSRFIGRLKRSRYVQELRQTFPPELEGSNIWVVDEWRHMGTSAMIAQTLLEAAFLPKGGRVRTFYMHHHEPPWLRKESWIGVHEDSPEDLLVHPLENGQGIDEIQYQQGDHVHIAHESHPDVSMQLRAEIRRLVREFAPKTPTT